MPTEFTPVSALIGGALIGLAATLLLWLNGRIAGISGIVNGAIAKDSSDRGWRLAFLAGLAGGAALWFAFGESFGVAVPAIRSGFPLWQLILAGALVGFGTRLGSGCTSGHGICGIARLSPRSLVAVAVFMGLGFVTVAVVRHLLGGAA